MAKENKGTILIADDEEGCREVIKNFFDSGFPGYSIEEFNDGNLLKNRLEKELQNPNDVKLLITDNQMPGITGGELINEYARKIKFPVILHYSGSLYIGEEAVRNGAYDYLRKPCAFDNFIKIVKRALDKNYLG